MAWRACTMAYMWRSEDTSGKSASLSYILVGSGNQTPAVKNSGSQSLCTGSGLHSLPCGILHVSHVSCIRELLSSNVMGKWFLTISSCSARERMMTWSGAVESWHWNGTPVFHGGVHNPKDLIAFENSPSHWRQAWNEFPFTISVWRKSLTCFPLDRHQVQLGTGGLTNQSKCWSHPTQWHAASSQNIFLTSSLLNSTSSAESYFLFPFPLGLSQ